MVFAKLGRIAPRECGVLTSLRGAKRRSNPLLLRGNMDCFACARNDGLNTRHTFNRHRPRKRTIQYSRDADDGIEKPRRTGYPHSRGMTVEGGAVAWLAM